MDNLLLTMTTEQLRLTYGLLYILQHRPKIMPGLIYLVTSLSETVQPGWLKSSHVTLNKNKYIHRSLLLCGPPP